MKKTNILFGLWFAHLLILVACQSSPSTTPPLADGQLAPLPRPVIVDLGYTATPFVPTPTATSVMEHLWTPTPTVPNTPLPSEGLALVTQVLSPEILRVILEGDPINRGYDVRLIGVQAPQDDEAWYQLSLKTLDAWVKGKVVRLSTDITVINRAGELPRYVYLDNALINQQLLEAGLALVDIQVPDDQFQDAFEAAAAEARTETRGLWGPLPTGTSLIATSIPLSITPTLALTATPSLTSTTTPAP